MKGSGCGVKGVQLSGISFHLKTGKPRSPEVAYGSRLKSVAVEGTAGLGGVEFGD